MTNKEVLERGVLHEEEQLMYFLLAEFWKKLKEHGNLDAFEEYPVNLVTVYKDFLRKETFIDTNIYDQYHESEIVTDADWREL